MIRPKKSKALLWLRVARALLETKDFTTENQLLARQAVRRAELTLIAGNNPEGLQRRKDRPVKLKETLRKGIDARPS